MAKLPLNKWIVTLFAMAIHGGSSAALAVFGLAGANSLGMDVRPLDLKQAGAVFLAGAVVKTLRFLERNPMPNYEATDAGEDTTETKNTNSTGDK